MLEVLEQDKDEKAMLPDDERQMNSS